MRHKAWEFFENPKIVALHKKEMKRREKASELSSDLVLRYLSELLQFDIHDVTYFDDGVLYIKDTAVLTPAQRRCIQAYSQSADGAMKVSGPNKATIIGLAMKATGVGKGDVEQTPITIIQHFHSPTAAHRARSDATKRELALKLEKLKAVEGGHVDGS